MRREKEKRLEKGKRGKGKKWKRLSKQRDRGTEEKRKEGKREKGTLRTRSTRESNLGSTLSRIHAFTINQSKEGGSYNETRRGMRFSISKTALEIIHPQNRA
jgi:hypothetical protein